MFLRKRQKMQFYYGHRGGSQQGHERHSCSILYGQRYRGELGRNVAVRGGV